MPKPYSILAAALVASGRSHSTATLAAPVELHPIWRAREPEDWVFNSSRHGFADSESPFAIDPFAEFAIANAVALAA